MPRLDAAAKKQKRRQLLKLQHPGESVYSPGKLVYRPPFMGRPVSPPRPSKSCPRCGVKSPDGECSDCETYRCAHCQRWHSWEYGGSESGLCDLCWGRRRRARRVAAYRLVSQFRERCKQRPIKRRVIQKTRRRKKHGRKRV